MRIRPLVSNRTLPVCVFAIAVFITVSVMAVEPASPNASGRTDKLRHWTNLPWTHVDYPLFSLFGPFDHKPDALAVAKAIRSKSALDVYGFREVILADDDKGITIGLDDQDRRQLKRLAQKDKRRWFVAMAPPKDFFVGEPAVAVIYLTPSMADGQITFKHPECASTARALRWRFRIEEFRLTR